MLGRWFSNVMFSMVAVFRMNKRLKKYIDFLCTVIILGGKFINLVKKSMSKLYD